MSTPIDTEALMNKWNQVHEREEESVLRSMTVSQLCKHATKLGLTRTQLKEYGNLMHKKTYISAIRVAFLLYKEFVINDVPSEVSDFEERNDESEDEMASEKAKLAIQVADFEERKAAFEKQKAVTLQERTEFETRKANFERLPAARQVTVQERAEFNKMLAQHKQREFEQNQRENDFKKRQAAFETQVKDFESRSSRHSISTSRHEFEIRQLKEQCRKRKRECDDALRQKNVAISNIEQVLKRLKGEKYWTYACPSSLQGADAALWARHKCKRLVGGVGFTSDLLRVDGKPPRWKTLHEVSQALCATLVN